MSQPMSTAEAIVKFILSAPSCAPARAMRFDDCTCGCVSVFTRHVEELLEAEYARVAAQHRAAICAMPENG